MIYQRLCETVMFWQTPQSYSQISVLGCLSFPTKPSEFAGPHADLWKQAVVNTWIELGPSHSLPTLPLLLLGSSHTPFSELLGGPHSWVSWSQCTAANPHLGHTVTPPPTRLESTCSSHTQHQCFKTLSTNPRSSQAPDEMLSRQWQLSKLFRLEYSAVRVWPFD